MILHHSPASPFVRKVRVAGAELGLASQIRLESTHVAPTKPNRAYGEAVNPLRKIPALVTDDGQVIYDSGVICAYLDAMAGGGRIIPDGGDIRWQVLTDHALADGMCEAAVLLRYETAVRPEAYRWPEWIDDHWDRIWAGLDRFEAAPPMSDAAPDLAGIALGCLLGYLDFRFADCGWPARCPALAAWFAIVGARPSFAETRPA